MLALPWVRAPEAFCSQPSPRDLYTTLQTLKGHWESRKYLDNRNRICLTDRKELKVGKVIGFKFVIYLIK